MDAAGPESCICQIAHSFGLAFALATPFVIASLIYNLALGVINRAMPRKMLKPASVTMKAGMPS